MHAHTHTHTHTHSLSLSLVRLKMRKFSRTCGLIHPRTCIITDYLWRPNLYNLSQPGALRNMYISHVFKHTHTHTTAPNPTPSTTVTSPDSNWWSCHFQHFACFCVWLMSLNLSRSEAQYTAKGLSPSGEFYFAPPSLTGRFSSLFKIFFNPVCLFISIQYSCFWCCSDFLFYTIFCLFKLKSLSS